MKRFPNILMATCAAIALSATLALAADLATDKATAQTDATALSCPGAGNGWMNSSLMGSGQMGRGMMGGNGNGAQMMNGSNGMSGSTAQHMQNGEYSGRMTQRAL